MAKFKIGDQCRVVKNALAPKCIGQKVSIERIAVDHGGSNVLYICQEKIGDNYFRVYAHEKCLELAEKEVENGESK